MSMTSHRPYLVRALNEWILENDCTPYILVNAYAGGVEVPQDYVKDGQIVLNISPTAVQRLHISNDAIEFSARFGGVPTQIYVPIQGVMGIYARENGQGMMFDMEKPAPEPPPAVPADGSNAASKEGAAAKNTSKRPALRVVK